ncbi:hypothetical protein ACFQ36_04385 [Arthrobacter sp. GCM10027362]|uniref:hypothetical protein n=1 Tax=Arthrobacter sp. GCM10027362 TaxID=3273379 RepID=UPI0036295285
MSNERQPAGTDAGGLPPAVKPAGGRRGLAGLGLSVVCGIVAAVLGTSLHGQLLYVGGIGYPWGAVAALVFAWALMVWAGLKARNVFMAGVTGFVAYVLVGLMATGMGREPLIITATSARPELAVALAGKIWVLGLALATVFAVAVSAWALKPDGRD